jgi:putative transposase
MGGPADEDEQVHRRADRDGAAPGRGGTPVGEICRKLGVSEQSFYRWKKRFGTLGVSELRELRQLREENGQLKGLVADLSLDKTILHEALRKTW